MLGSATNPSTPFRANTPDVSTQIAESRTTSETLPHQAIRVDGSFGVSQGQVFIFHAQAPSQYRHGEIGIFCDGIHVISTLG